MYGDIVVNWKKENEGAIFNIEIPVNTSAKIYIPAKESKDVFEGGKLAENAEGVKLFRCRKK